MISIVIPSYNESGNIEGITSKLLHELQQEENFEIIFVDDGSTDGTLKEIKKVMGISKSVKFISLSRNFGHQRALKAGLDHARGDCVIMMDADLQHPPEMVPVLIEKWRQGNDVVYTIRKDSADVNYFKRLTSKYFYRFINSLSDVQIPSGAADFRLIDRKVLEQLVNVKEHWLFIRGIISWIGFRQIGIEYTVQARHSGKSKYTIRKMFSFAIQGLTSFSILPLRLSIILGIFFSLFAFLYGIYALYMKFFTDAVIKGWTSILISVLLLGGIQLVCLGVIGEYLGKMFIETKRRPSYIVREKSL
jgi:dolichol-phosphate mannosyltransferase